MARLEYLLAGLRGYSRLRDLHKSAFFADCGEEIESILLSPQVSRNTSAEPRIGSFLRIAQWNIEKGICLRGALDLLKSHDVLRWADVILLNEVDHGMARSGNLHVGGALADALGMHMAFAPAHFELARGDDELHHTGENTESMQGNAVLSRHPVLEANVVRLPVCFEPYEFREKRYGRRTCLWVKIAVQDRPLWLGSIHLEVRRTPACRARQMLHLMKHLPCSGGEPCLIGGDLNTNGFSRGSRWRTLRSSWRLVSTPPAVLQAQLCHPDSGTEPLFDEARRSGFSWRMLNSSEPTATAPIDGLEDADRLPAGIARGVRKRLASYGGLLHFKLDWLLGRGVNPLRSGEVCDRLSGVLSCSPGCVQTLRTGRERISDHSPIFADIRL